MTIRSASVAVAAAALRPAPSADGYRRIGASMRTGTGSLQGTDRSAGTVTPRIAMVAGEASGDLLAGLLLGRPTRHDTSDGVPPGGAERAAGLYARWPGLHAAGIGGARMVAHGFDAWWPSDKLAVRGYAEVLAHYREIVGIRRALATRLLGAERPDLFIGVDVPDFNLALEARLRAAGIKTVHFVSPSIWAWRGGRIGQIGRAVDHMLCVFPFEPALYAPHGVPATYVGHPLADAIPLEVPRTAARHALGFPDGDTLVALLPGSRQSEVRYIAPTLLQAAAELARRRPALRFVLPLADGVRGLVEPLVAAHAGAARVTLVDGRSHDALAACDVTLIASGTATLEAALFKRPMVITYKMHWLTYQMMRRQAYQPWYGLPNILLEDFAVPELMQDAATPSALADAALAWLDDPARCAALAARFVALHHLLRRDTATLATDAIAQVLAR